MCLAIPGKLIEIDADDDPLTRGGLVDFGALQKRVALCCVPEARAGDHVLVHAGLAIAVVDAERAAALLEALRATGELEELEAGGDADA